MTMTDFKELQLKKDLAAYAVVGSADAILTCHKSGLEIRENVWDILEKRMAELHRLEKDLRECLEMESMVATLPEG